MIIVSKATSTGFWWNSFTGTLCNKDFTTFLCWMP